MQLNDCTIIHIAQYAAPYEGNFIKSIKFLEQVLTQKYNCKMIYVFPEKAKEQAWYDEFSNNHIVYTTNNNVKDSKEELFAIFDKHKPIIIHTHFEGYDIPAKKVANKLYQKNGHRIQQIWHLHDYFSYIKHPLKYIYQRFCFFKHYCLHAKDVSIIGVCDEIKDFVKSYKKLSLESFHTEATIPNGIDFQRITHVKDWTNITHIRNFLAFGGRNIQKRIDLIFKAFDKITNKTDIQPHLILVKGDTTTELINKLYNGITPNWLTIIEPQEDITLVLSQADCFISSSVHETFSYAICEATIFGIPVIQSDIPGTMWNADNPSTYLFKSLNDSDLAQQIINVINTPIAQLQNNCAITRANNKKEYSLNNWVDRIIDFYHQQ